jgi:hypothetical protein
METGILPDPAVMKVLEDPFGFNMLVTGEKHVNPNRFFSHFFFREYFLFMPLFLQKFTDPISSVYLSGALIKILVHIMFIYFLAKFITGRGKITDDKFILVAVIVSPLLQAYGYWSRMGIIDHSVTYVFFYALPLVLLMMFIFPILQLLYRNSRMSVTTFVLLLPFTVILPLSSPLIPGVILILVCVQLLFLGVSKFFASVNFFPETKVQTKALLLLSLATFWSLYSVFLGFFDSNYEEVTIPLIQRYQLLPRGIVSQVLHSAGVPLLLAFIGINIFIIRKNYHAEAGRKWLFILIVICLFSVIYILLLPVGGYRPYRPLIIRYDTIMPVTILLIYFFSASTFLLINKLKRREKNLYMGVLFFVLLVFSAADLKGLNRNKNEREAIQKIAESSLDIVSIPKGYLVMSWADITDYNQSGMKAEMLYYWNIINSRKLFYNQPE